MESAIVLLLFGVAFGIGSYMGQKQTNEQLIAEITEHKAANDSLLRRYEQVKINQIKEREHYDKVIKALSDDATAGKIDRIIRSMDASSTQR